MQAESVNHACGLLEVSRAAYYQRRNGEAWELREVTDAELTEKITAVHSDSKGTYGSPLYTGNCLTRRGVPKKPSTIATSPRLLSTPAMRLTRTTAAQRPSQKLSLSVSPWPRARAVEHGREAQIGADSCGSCTRIAHRGSSSARDTRTSRTIDHLTGRSCLQLCQSSSAAGPRRPAGKVWEVHGAPHLERRAPELPTTTPSKVGPFGSSVRRFACRCTW